MDRAIKKGTGYSNKLDLNEFFFNLKNQIYVIIKLGTFPDYYKGDDIDLFCYDINKIAKIILGVGNKYLNKKFEINVDNKDESHIYIDFYFGSELEFRFDLYQSLPKYKKIQIKDSYIFSIIENAIPVFNKFRGIKYPVYVPSSVDDLLLRYIEYIEWYELRPDKIKHIDYIINKAPSESTRINFLDKLYLYTRLPDSTHSEFKKKGILRLCKEKLIMFKKRLGRLVRKYNINRRYHG